jgi:hypothetical protein
MGWTVGRLFDSLLAIAELSNGCRASDPTLRRPSVYRGHCDRRPLMRPAYGVTSGLCDLLCASCTA